MILQNPIAEQGATSVNNLKKGEKRKKEREKIQIDFA